MTVIDRRCTMPVVFTLAFGAALAQPALAQED